MIDYAVRWDLLEGGYYEGQWNEGERNCEIARRAICWRSTIRLYPDDGFLSYGCDDLPTQPGPSATSKAICHKLSVCVGRLSQYR